MAEEKITICVAPRTSSAATRRVLESEVQAQLDTGAELGSCDLNSKLDASEYYPDKLKDLELNEELINIIQKIIDDSDYRDIRDKYKNYNSLSGDVLDEIIDEYGYKYIADMVALTDEEKRSLLGFIGIIHILKGSRSGLELVLSLTVDSHLLVEWWQFITEPAQLGLFGKTNDIFYRTNTPESGMMTYTIEPDTFYAKLEVNHTQYSTKLYDNFQDFARQYVYPLLVKLDIRIVSQEIADITVLEVFAAILASEYSDKHALTLDGIKTNTSLHHTNNRLNTFTKSSVPITENVSWLDTLEGMAWVDTLDGIQWLNDSYTANVVTVLFTYTPLVKGSDLTNEVGTLTNSSMKTAFGSDVTVNRTTTPRTIPEVDQFVVSQVTVAQPKYILSVSDRFNDGIAGLSTDVFVSSIINMTFDERALPLPRLLTGFNMYTNGRVPLLTSEDSETLAGMSFVNTTSGMQWVNTIDGMQWIDYSFVSPTQTNSEMVTNSRYGTMSPVYSYSSNKILL